jgi:hypothetical protein
MGKMYNIDEVTEYNFIITDGFRYAYLLSTRDGTLSISKKIL